MQAWAIWVIAGVVALIIDLLTAGLFMIWVGGGCFVAALVAWLAPAVPWAPWAAFVLSTAVLLYLGLPLARRLHERQPLTPSNVDALIGREAIVLEAIDPIQNTGRIRIGSDQWRARAAERIEAGTRVEVRGVEGTTLTVAALAEPPASFRADE